MTIEEKAKRAWEEYCYRADGSLYSTVFEDAYKQGATEALASQWVSVEERLPEDDTLVTIHSPNGRVEVLHYYDYAFQDELKQAHCVDYWLPIPELPTKGGEQ